ncbi:MAG: metallophosphoesterase [Erysipelotrichales bacterium]|nr:metallophosphoesterase [Erysipelotrichales bacterium]
MKRKKKIVLLSIFGITAVLVPLFLIAQFGKDPTNYQKEYIDSLKPIPTRSLIFDDSKDNIAVINEENTDFKILQLSDIHFAGARRGKSLDLKTLKAVYEMVDYVRPDMIVYTGDLIYPTRVSGSNDNIKAATVLNLFFEKMGVPFLYEFGNHDTEIFATGTAEDINEIFQSNPYCYAKDDENNSYQTGRLTQLFEIRNHDNTLNTALILLDSGSYIDGSSFFSGYAKFTRQYMYWYERKLLQLKNQEEYKNISEISSLAFFHIPPYEYREAVRLYEEESEEVTFIYGENNETISCPTGESDLFKKMFELNSTKAVFFGHDHKNSLALKYQGIEFYYGHSIDYNSYPFIQYTDEYRGGVTITIKPDSSYVVEPLLLKDIKK